MSEQRGAIRFEAVGKKFGGASALRDITISVDPGTALGIVGENGAGKSTLMKIVGGVYPFGSYDGSVQISGAEARFRTVQDARAAGVVLIPQELLIAPELSIAENMFAGSLPSRLGLVKQNELLADARKWLEFFDLAVDPALPASVLSSSEQRLASIAGALSRDAAVLILDEPTASLSQGETETLVAHVRRLKERGITVLFISHRLDDIAQVCDEVVVLRNGDLVATFHERNVPRARIVEAMIGRSIDLDKRPTGKQVSAERALEVHDLVVRDPQDRRRIRVDRVSFTVGKGEVVAIFGLVGSGRTEILRAIFGTWPVSIDGNLRLDGADYRPTTPRAAIAKRIGMVTEDRKQTGIFSGHSLRSNFDAASPGPVATYGFLRSQRDDARAWGLMRKLDVRARHINQNIETLSGGNQQKVLLGRWLAVQPVLLLLDEPTAGVDVGAREDIYTRIEELAKQGCGVLLISSDIDEVLRISDRTHVMYKGRLVAEHVHPSRQDLMAAATGGLE